MSKKDKKVQNNHVLPNLAFRIVKENIFRGETMYELNFSIS